MARRRSKPRQLQVNWENMACRTPSLHVYSVVLLLALRLILDISIRGVCLSASNGVPDYAAPREACSILRIA